LMSPGCWAMIVAIFLTGVLLVGLYPSFLMTRIRSTDCMRGKMLHGRKGSNVRKLLILVQFVASFILVAGTFTVVMQVNYMQRESSDSLFDRVVVLKYPSSTDDMPVRISDFKKRLEQSPSVGRVSVSGAVPGVEVANYFTNRPYGSDVSETKLIQMFAVDYDYLTIYAPEFVCGRGFSEDYGNEYDKVVLNEQAVKILGYSSAEDALGRQLAMEVLKTPLEIIGVVRDYQQQSYAEPYKPIIFFLKERVPIIATPYISVMLTSAVTPETIADIERIYKSYFPLAAFSYFRLSDFNHNLYRSDRNFSRIFTCASMLAVFVACLGLWIMTLFSTMSRLKEVGIRKVLGADKKSLFMVLTKELVTLTMIAAAVGTPVSALLMNEWLKSYAFHITPPWWIYVVAFALITAVGLLTVARQIWRVIRINPIDILRNE
ncbi:MAG: FtsX-like permease family protein, partial [Muribaculaceae bacterium]|nr:FtsX-like permease family protein [Muribaculaceae bacterium]